MEVRPPKGTRDFTPEQMLLRKRVFGIVTKIFEQHGAVSIDTPLFELREVLEGKYGEDSKLIYNLEDQGGQLLSLRYDLTVPFARYLASKRIFKMTRYQIGKVYRRDNPSRGRYREFYQCDFDIAGRYPLMFADAEVVTTVIELLDALDIGDYKVKVNHRKLLHLLLESCQVPEDKLRPICSAIDKLDKCSWEKVRTEMVEEKGLPAEVADRVGEQVSKRGKPADMLAYMKEYFTGFELSSESAQVLEELEMLFSYLEVSNSLDRVVLDLSLARGLDYYTGLIFEAVFTGSTQVGSIAAGGRYDELVGRFGRQDVPVVGLSLGMERVLLILEEREQPCKSRETQVLVLSLEKNAPKEVFRLASELRATSLNVECEATSSRKLKNQLEMAAKACIPYVVVVGEDEERRGVVQLKAIVEKSAEKVTSEEVPRAELATVIWSKVGRANPTA